MGREADAIFMTRENIGELQVDAVVELSCIPASSKIGGFPDKGTGASPYIREGNGVSGHVIAALTMVNGQPH